MGIFKGENLITLGKDFLTASRAKVQMEKASVMVSKEPEGIFKNVSQRF